MLWQFMLPIYTKGASVGTNSQAVRFKKAATSGAWWMKLLELCWCPCELFGSLVYSCNLFAAVTWVIAAICCNDVTLDLDDLSMVESLWYVDHIQHVKEVAL